MYKTIVFCLTIAIGVSCKQQADGQASMNKFKAEMPEEVSAAQKKVFETYQDALINTNDPSIKQDLEKTYLSLTRCCIYIDSLNTELHKLDMSPTAVKSIQRVVEIFAFEKAARGIFTRLNTAYQMERNMATADSTRATIDVHLKKYTEREIEDYFMGYNAFGATGVLKRLELELLRLGNETLQGYIRRQ